MNLLSHIDEKGKANMVDVGAKPDQERMAVAVGKIFLTPETVAAIQENELKKGDVLTVAEVAAIQGAKRTVDLIPLCHQINLTKVSVKARLLCDGVEVECMAKSVGKTGVEMEALTGVSVALLTIYDMCKAIDKTMVMSEIKLLKKSKEELFR